MATEWGQTRGETPMATTDKHMHLSSLFTGECGADFGMLLG